MNKTIVPIPYKKIFLPFNEKVAPATVTRIEKLKPYYSIYDVVVPVEKDKDKDFYHLVGAIPLFLSLYKEDDDVPCIVEPTTTHIERLLKIGRRFHNQYTKPESKRELIHSIMVQGYSSRDVIKETDLNVSRYIYRSTIPTEIIEQNSTLNNPVSPHTINMIDTLPSPLTSKIKTYLINKALNDRLTQTHIKNIKKMVKYSMNDFIKLSYPNQIKVIQYVISSPALLPQLWHNKIEQLKRRSY